LGVNLKELKESFKECKFSIQTVIIIALQLLNRLNSIHSQGYIHRDLKPANVVIGNDSNEAHFIYLIDFGLAKKENSTNPPIEVSKQSGKNGVIAVGPVEEEPINIIDPKTGKKKTAM
jgi:serine/threonine protein kinase